MLPLFVHVPFIGHGQLTIGQQEFINMLLPVIKQVNREISEQRSGIYELYQKFRTPRGISSEQSQIIYKYLKFYRCDVPADFSTFELRDAHFKELLRKIDIIPQKLILAQAALESNWGKSRFAKDGFNFFGIRCMSRGCGYKPKNAEDKNFMVKAYPSMLDGLRDYTRLLNSSKYYKELRDLRIADRLNAELPNPMEMAKGLENFSIKRIEYVNSLIYMMKHNFYYF